MEFETNFKNKELYLRKTNLLEEILSSLEKERAKLTSNISCDYHGENLVFHSHDDKLRNGLLSLLPKNWIVDDLKSPHEIYIFNPENYGISIEEWQSEESQDCFINNIQQSAIQRDFISIQRSEKETILICSDQVDDGLNNFLRWFLPRRLLKRDILVFHSSCVIENQRAKIFLGHSGAGKSTMVSLSNNREHLSDDMNLVIKKDNEYYVQAGAIGGLFFDKVDYSKLYPIDSFSWLIQDSEFKSNKLSQTKSYIKAMSSVSNVFWESLEEHSTQLIMDTVKDITEKISFYDLHFKKDEEVWNYVE
jgi:hypothetical protein